MTADRPTTAARSLIVLGRVVDLVLLAIVAIGLSSVILGRVLPATGHPVFVVAGPSMSPAIPIGAAVILDTVPTSELVVGDVVSLQSGGQRAVFTHRITRLVDRDGEPWIETKGDANAEKDPSITPASAVIGRVAATVPNAGYLLALMSTPPGVILVLSTGALLIVVGWWLDDLAASRRRTARRPTLLEPVPAAEPVAVRTVATGRASVRLDQGASPRRRAQHPLRSGEARRRASRGTNPRPTGQGA
jgi:signal peptidase I